VSISPDGRFVAFTSDASNLVSGDGNGVRDVFVRDRDTDRDGVYDEPGAVKTFRASIPEGGGQANNRSDQPSIDVDYDAYGDAYIYVAFRSFANNLESGDTNNVSDIFVYFDNPYGVWTDRVSMPTTRNHRGRRQILHTSIAASIDFFLSIPIASYDVAFASKATNLVAGDANGVADIFVRSNTNQTRRFCRDGRG
jgi:hypothetical protein